MARALGPRPRLEALRAASKCRVESVLVQRGAPGGLLPNSGRRMHRATGRGRRAVGGRGLTRSVTGCLVSGPKGPLAARSPRRSRAVPTGRHAVGRIAEVGTDSEPRRWPEAACSAGGRGWAVQGTSYGWLLQSGAAASEASAEPASAVPTVSHSTRATLRVLRLNSTPTRWTGLPEPRCWSA